MPLRDQSISILGSGSVFFLSMWEGEHETFVQETRFEGRTPKLLFDSWEL